MQEWLDELGLKEYWPMFERNSYIDPTDLEDLKALEKDILRETLDIRKQGHLNRLISALRKLRYSNKGK